ncbi:DDE_3 domain-containing protein [Trichonephila clavipes]|nr:DDE_3 domain-containing protein [Trichonephila clavipes]
MHCGHHNSGLVGCFPTRPGLICNLILAGLKYGERQVPVTTKRTPLNDTVTEDITRMDWPAYSPDLNTIEHVWNMLGRRIAARQLPPICLPELRRALLDEWCNIPQDQIDNLILSMPRRCKACIASSERHTPY